MILCGPVIVIIIIDSTSSIFLLFLLLSIQLELLLCSGNIKNKKCAPITNIFAQNLVHLWLAWSQVVTLTHRCVWLNTRTTGYMHIWTPDVMRVVRDVSADIVCTTLFSAATNTVPVVCTLAHIDRFTHTHSPMHGAILLPPDTVSPFS